VVKLGFLSSIKIWYVRYKINVWIHFRLEKQCKCNLNKLSK